MYKQIILLHLYIYVITIEISMLYSTYHTPSGHLVGSVIEHKM